MNAYVKDGIAYVDDKAIGKIEDIRKITGKIVDMRNALLKQYTTKELLTELKSRGINMPKKYR